MKYANAVVGRKHGFILLKQFIWALHENKIPSEKLNSRA
jgi:hypothetical protein